MAAEYPTAADVAASVPHFDDCLEYVRALPKAPGVGGEAPLGDAHRLVLYGLFKQATVGPAADNPSAAPGMLAGPEARFKYAAWKTFSSLSKDAAKARYADVVALTALGSDTPSSPNRAFYDDMRAKGARAPAFLRTVWSRAAGEPRLWTLGRELGDAVERSLQLTLSDADALALKACRWQATFGNVVIDRPGLIGGMAGLLSAAEWDAWDALRGTPQPEAVELFTCKVCELAE